jgi:hypothetical protein
MMTMTQELFEILRKISITLITGTTLILISGIMTLMNG